MPLAEARHLDVVTRRSEPLAEETPDAIDGNEVLEVTHWASLAYSHGHKQKV